MFATTFDPDKPSRTQLTGVPAGHDARVLADIALRTHGKPVVFVAIDDVRAAGLSDAELRLVLRQNVANLLRF